jgi:hypothetical protein
VTTSVLAVTNNARMNDIAFLDARQLKKSGSKLGYGNILSRNCIQ